MPSISLLTLSLFLRPFPVPFFLFPSILASVIRPFPGPLSLLLLPSPPHSIACSLFPPPSTFAYANRLFLYVLSPFLSLSRPIRSSASILLPRLPSPLPSVPLLTASHYSFPRPFVSLLHVPPSHLIQRAPFHPPFRSSLVYSCYMLQSQLTAPAQNSHTDQAAASRPRQPNHHLKFIG